MEKQLSYNTKQLQTTASKVCGGRFQLRLIREMRVYDAIIKILEVMRQELIINFYLCYWKKLLSQAVVQRCSIKRCSCKFHFISKTKTLLIKRLAEVFSCEFCGIFRSTFFKRTPPEATCEIGLEQDWIHDISQRSLNQKLQETNQFVMVPLFYYGST